MRCPAQPFPACTDLSLREKMGAMEAPAPAAGGHVVLCGLNELGYRTLEELARLDVDVVVVVRSAAEELARGARELGATLVPGSYRDQAVLRAAGVPTARALVITEDDDVGNLHAALAAQELNPALRMRLRLFNRELGRRVEDLFEDCQVFDSAALAVPAFVSAALLQDWQQRVEVAGRTLVVRRAPAGGPGVLLPLADVRPDGTTELFPDEGEELLCLAEAPPPARRSRHPERPALEQPGRVAAWTVLLRTDLRLRVMTAIVLVLTVTGIGIFWLFSEQDLDLIDAIYFTVTIMTTTGFGDIHLRNAPPPLQLYGVALMLSGTAALAILFALITDALISARLARVIGAAIPRGLHDHVVVCGLGNIGYRMVEQLHELGVPLVAAELQEGNRYLPAVRRLGVPVLVADIRLPETLQTLQVQRARSVVVVTSSDIVNLETALNVQALKPEVRVVLRLFDPDLAARVERAFGIHISRSPSALAAPAFAAAAAGEHVLTTIAVGAEVLAVVRLRVEPGCRAEGHTVAELEAAAASRLLVLDDGQGPRWRPDSGIALTGGAELVAVIPRGELGRVLAWTEAGAHPSRHTRNEATPPVIPSPPA
jgi:Trk K+ transport system NAD-binding subunit